MNKFIYVAAISGVSSGISLTRIFDTSMAYLGYGTCF